MKKTFKLWRVAVAVLAIVSVSATVAYYRGVLQPFGIYRPTNSIMVLAPYRHAGTWVFDDAAVGLTREPFVSGIPAIIDDMVKSIPDADAGFRLLFSAQPFPGHTHQLTWLRADQGGNWYFCEQLEQEGWLCPALFRYYREAPRTFYAKAEPK